MRVSPGANHMYALGTVFQRLGYLIRIKHLVADHIIDLVEHDQIVLAAVNRVSARFPALLCELDVFGVRFRSADFHESPAHRRETRFPARKSSYPCPARCKRSAALFLPPCVIFPRAASRGEGLKVW